MIRRLFIVLVFLLCILDVSAQITIADYVVDVVEYSHLVKNAAAMADGVEAEMKRVRKDYLPALSVSSDASYTFRNRDEKGQLDWVMRADVHQPIFDGGRVRAEATRTEYLWNKSQSLVQQSLLDERYNAEVAYWSLSRAEIYCNTMNHYLDIVEQLRDVVAHRFNEGYTSKSDLLQVDSRLSDVQYQLSQAEQRRLVALHNFNVMRGADPELSVVLIDSINDTLSMPTRVAISDVVATHPSYVAAVSEREAARYGVKVRRASYLPSVNVGLFGVWQPKGITMSGAGTYIDGGVVISLSAPIFHFMERRDAMSVARSEHRRAELAVDDIKDNIALDESNGWANLVATRQRVDAARRNLEIAHQNLEISTYSYQEGVVTILEVLQAQLSWLQIYQNAISAQYDYAIAIASYRYIIAY